MSSNVFSKPVRTSSSESTCLDPCILLPLALVGTYTVIHIPLKFRSTAQLAEFGFTSSHCSHAQVLFEEVLKMLSTQLGWTQSCVCMWLRCFGVGSDSGT